MKGTTNWARNQEQGNNWNISNLMGATEMKIATQIEKAKLGRTNGIKNNSPARFLGALVLGAALVAIAATGFTPGQVQAAENRLSVQMEIGEEWFNPVTGEPIGQLPTQVNQRSIGVLASPLRADETAWGLPEENYHLVTGEMIPTPAKNVEVRSFNLGEENYHPVTGEMVSATGNSVEVSSFNLGEENYHPVTGEMIAGAAKSVEVSSFNLGEENYHPVTGEMISTAVEMSDIGAIGLGEEHYHPVSGQLDTNDAIISVSSFGMAEESFHPITGDLV